MNKTYTLIILFALVVVAGVVMFRTDNEPSNTQTNETESSEQCVQQSALEICVDPDRTEITDTESVNLFFSIRNISDEQFETTFSTTCTDPQLFINDAPAENDQICGQALTDVIIAEKETKVYKESLSATELKAGENRLHFEWDDYRSSEFTITKS